MERSLMEKKTSDVSSAAEDMAEKPMDSKDPHLLKKREKRRKRKGKSREVLVTESTVPTRPSTSSIGKLTEETSLEASEETTEDLPVKSILKSAKKTSSTPMVETNPTSAEETSLDLPAAAMSESVAGTSSEHAMMTSPRSVEETSLVEEISLQYMEETSLVLPAEVMSESVAGTSSERAMMTSPRSVEETSPMSTEETSLVEEISLQYTEETSLVLPAAAMSESVAGTSSERAMMTSPRSVEETSPTSSEKGLLKHVEETNAELLTDVLESSEEDTIWQNEKINLERREKMSSDLLISDTELNDEPEVSKPAVKLHFGSTRMFPEDTADSLENVGGIIERRRSRIRRFFDDYFDWFPKMCSCLDSSGTMGGSRSTGRSGFYQRLSSGPTIFELSNMMQRSRRRGHTHEKSLDTERQEELRFYNNDLSWNSVVVEKNLRTIDLCELLKVKRNASGIAWSIVETWPELGIERTLEDHEDILACHREMEMFASHHERKFYFREDFLKYEFFINPKQFFPACMVSLPNDEDLGIFGNLESALRLYLSRDDSECPQVFSLVCIRDDDSSSWKKTYMLLQGRKLYTSKKMELIQRSVKEYKSWWFRGASALSSSRSLKSRLSSPKSSKSQRSSSPKPSTSGTSSSTSKRQRPATVTGAVPKRILDNEQLTPIAHLSDYHIYRIPNAQKYFNAPFEWGACLRPSSNAEAEDTEAGEPGLKIIAFQSEKIRACWLTAMRLAKYGKQLRENYRAFKNKQCEQTGGGSTKEQYNSYNVSNESIRSRVAMDFTGSVGRIVDDPKEAKDIAESEGIHWRRRWRPFSRQPPGCATVRLHGLDHGVHMMQPWFHSNLKRENAAAILRDHGSVDGMFLVRYSKSNPGAYVLSYKYNEKIFHAQIQPVYDERGNCWLYTLDKGETKFYDLLQLIEFYQLNAGSLPTRLTHYIQNGVPIPQSRPEDGNASPSPPEGTQRLNPKNECAELATM